MYIQQKWSLWCVVLLEALHFRYRVGRLLMRPESVFAGGISNLCIGFMVGVVLCLIGKFSDYFSVSKRQMRIWLVVLLGRQYHTTKIYFSVIPVVKGDHGHGWNRIHYASKLYTRKRWSCLQGLMESSFFSIFSHFLILMCQDQMAPGKMAYFPPCVLSHRHSIINKLFLLISILPTHVIYRLAVDQRWFRREIASSKPKMQVVVWWDMGRKSVTAIGPFWLLDSLIPLQSPNCKHLRIQAVEMNEIALWSWSPFVGCALHHSWEPSASRCVRWLNCGLFYTSVGSSNVITDTRPIRLYPSKKHKDFTLVVLL